jgi:hypothetical protein
LRYFLLTSLPTVDLSPITPQQVLAMADQQIDVVRAVLQPVPYAFV